MRSPQHLALRLLLLAALAPTLTACRAQTTLAPETLHVCNSQINVTFTSGALDLPRADVLHWVQTAADSVATYFGRFPVPSMDVRVRISSDDRGVLNGTTWGGDNVRTRMGFGEHTTLTDLNDDWTMTHEFVHTAFPDLADEHHWIEEGLAVYVEPIARVQHGTQQQQQVWSDMIHDMPKGQPGPNDRGLNHDHSWGRTYWGGALFFLVADVTIRERTHNTRGLQDALRAILSSGLSMQRDSTPEEAFAIGDRAIGVPVLTELYNKVRDTPITEDLPALWRKLGVRPAGNGRVLYDDKAPETAIRKAIFAPQPMCAPIK